MDTEFKKIKQRQGTRVALNSVIRDRFLGFDIDSNHLIYSKDGASYFDFYNSGEIDLKLSNITPDWTVISNRPTNVSYWFNDAGYLTPSSFLDPSKISQSTNFRLVSDAEKSYWNGKVNPSDLALYSLKTDKHIIGDTTGLQAALDSKLSIATAASTYQPLGSYIGLSSLLSGYVVGANSAIASSDSILGAFQKLQGQINNKQASGSYAEATHNHNLVYLGINANAASSSKLLTARTIAGVSFDGSANISIPFANLSSKPTTLAGFGISSGDTLFDSKYLKKTTDTLTGTLTVTTAYKLGTDAGFGLHGDGKNLYISLTSQDNTHTGLIAPSTNTAINPIIGRYDYRFYGVYAGVGDFNSIIEDGVSLSSKYSLSNHGHDGYFSRFAGSIHSNLSYGFTEPALAIGDNQYGFSSYGGWLNLYSANGGAKIYSRISGNNAVYVGTLATQEHITANFNPLISGLNQANWNTVFGNVHSHGNMGELNAIATGDIAKWNDVTTKVYNSRIGQDTYAGTDTTTLHEKMLTLGNHFGRVNYAGTPAWFNYVMLRESTGTTYGVIGCGNDDNWYVGRAGYNVDITAFRKIWDSGNFDISGIIREGDSRLTDARTPITHSHNILGNLGGTNFGRNIDTQFVDGITQFAAYTIDAPTGNKPYSSWTKVMEIAHSDGNWTHQIALDYFSNSMSFRRKDGENWQAWNHIHHSGNFDPATKQNTLGYTPLKNTSDTLTGDFTATESINAKVLRANMPVSGDGAGQGAHIAIYDGANNLGWLFQHNVTDDRLSFMHLDNGNAWNSKIYFNSNGSIHAMGDSFVGSCAYSNYLRVNSDWVDNERARIEGNLIVSGNTTVGGRIVSNKIVMESTAAWSGNVLYPTIYGTNSSDGNPYLMIPSLHIPFTEANNFTANGNFNNSNDGGSRIRFGGNKTASYFGDFGILYSRANAFTSTLPLYINNDRVLTELDTSNFLIGSNGRRAINSTGSPLHSPKAAGFYSQLGDSINGTTGGQSWTHLINCRGSDWTDAGQYTFQIASSFSGDGNTDWGNETYAMRTITAGTPNSWKKLWHSGNLTQAKVNDFASKAGNNTFTGNNTFSGSVAFADRFVDAGTMTITNQDKGKMFHMSGQTLILDNSIDIRSTFFIGGRFTLRYTGVLRARGVYYYSATPADFTMDFAGVLYFYGSDTWYIG